jgi:sucrose PTS system EIIBCA or EIIBC component
VTGPGAAGGGGPRPAGPAGRGALEDVALAAAVLPLVGGAANVAAVEACSSRLRLVLRDDALGQQDALRTLPGVLMVLTQGGQLQLALGARAVRVCREVRRLVDPAG